MSDPLDIVASTAEAAFATDEEGRIVIWNRPAERLLGHSAERVLGKPCHEVLCGRDVFGNRFCDEDCALQQMVHRHEAVRRFEMEIRRESGQLLRVGVAVIVVPGPKPSQYSIIHLLQPLPAERKGGDLVSLGSPPAAAAAAAVATAAFPPPPAHSSLSAREVEVLRLLADGASTSAVADRLFISVATVRNHIQNILRKLDVHSKLEAVSLALRSRLI